MNLTLNCLKSLSTELLESQAIELVKEEGRCASALVSHLVEITNRRIHLDLGFSGLEEYCVTRLGLS